LKSNAAEKKQHEANDNDKWQNRRNGSSQRYLEAQATINNQQYNLLTLWREREPLNAAVDARNPPSSTFLKKLSCQIGKSE
jgi:hypothetical protein